MVCRVMGFIVGAPVPAPRVRKGCARAAETDMRADTSSTHTYRFIMSKNKVNYKGHSNGKKRSTYLSQEVER